MGLGSGIRDPRSGIKPIPDPGSRARVKKASDPGSGSATLIVTIPGSSLFCSAAPRHVDRDEELHVLVALPGEVVDGEQQHVRVGLGRGCYRMPGTSKEKVNLL
jgi:hypothetical protein